MHFRHILLHYFRKCKGASQAHKNLLAVYENKALNEMHFQNEFAKFRTDDIHQKMRFDLTI